MFALALDSYYDSIILEVNNTSTISIVVEGTYSKLIPTTVEKNTAGLVAKTVLDKLSGDYGLTLTIHKEVPIGKGLGSSAASSSACAIGLNELFKLHLDPDELVKLAAVGEKASAGTPHYDNVAAAILGGFVIVRSNPFHVIPLSAPKNLEIAIVIPNMKTIKEKTRKARQILPENLSLKQLVANVGNAAGIVAGLTSSNIELMGRSMVDMVVEPARSPQIPGYHTVREAALNAGASGVAISGAGPSIMAVIDNQRASALKVGNKMKESLQSLNVNSQVLWCKPSGGARIIEKE